MASENVSTDTVSKAVDALLKWRRSQSETLKPKLFDEDEEYVYLILTLKKIPSKSRVNPHKIPLPHSLFSPFSLLNSTPTMEWYQVLNSILFSLLNHTN